MSGDVVMQNVEIRFKGQIKKEWSEWFGGLSISHSDLGETILTGVVTDQAALYGVISRLRDLNIQLISVRNEEAKGNGMVRDASNEEIEPG